jgi:hypothetical protein
MSLEKIKKIDKIEIVGEYKNIQVREATIIKEDGVELSRAFHRYSLSPDADVSGQPTDIVEISKLYWTDELKQKYADSLENN